VDARLDQLESVYPQLVSHARDWVGDRRSTPVLRGLVQEGVSIRNARRILELLLDLYLERADFNVPTAIAFVRRGLAQHQLARYLCGDVVLAYLVDDAIEQAVLDPSMLTDGESDLRQRVVHAIRAELGTIPRTIVSPVLLTSAAVRPRLEKLIAAELPRLAVVGYDDLAPAAAVQLVARITLADG
jgi:type III secretory pathway component EscV